MKNRRGAREDAFKLLFQIDINDQHSLDTKQPFTKLLTEGVIKNKIDIDQLIADHLINWTIDRISPVDKTILRIAIYEILHEEDIPYAVSINEAVELAHRYGDDQSSKFINGVLSEIVKKGEKQNDR